MRGFRLVGRIGGEDQAVVLGRCDPDSLLALSPRPDGPMRDGLVRARDTSGTCFEHWPIATAALGDYVFVATAIGEHAFGVRCIGCGDRRSASCGTDDCPVPEQMDER